MCFCSSDYGKNFYNDSVIVLLEDLLWIRKEKFMFRNYFYFEKELIIYFFIV